MSHEIIALKDVSKVYPGVTALDGVSLAVHRSEVLGLVGENGAGKSTLMKILGGVVPPTGGSIRIDGTEIDHLSVKSSMAAGIAFVHQELNLFDNLTVAGNIFIGREPRRAGTRWLIDEARMAADTRPLLAQLGADFDARTPLANLSLAQRQLVEIAKALSLNARLIIMDEPTSSLTTTETEQLLKTVIRLRESGVSVIFISHRLAEVQTIADRVVVLRDGRQVAELQGSDIRPDLMIRHMIGRDLANVYRAPKAAPGQVILDISELETQQWRGRPNDLQVRAGEIVGLTGLVGSGRTELAETIFGLNPPVAGMISIGGRVLAVNSPQVAIANGIYLVPEDRKRTGLILDFPIETNITLASLSKFSRSGLVSHDAERTTAEEQRRALDIRCPDTGVVVQSLSGGNQQKVVLGKWLSMAPKLLIFDEPTRGIDVGAKSEIYQLMRDLSDRGVGILMISSDMEEVIGVSDRVVVMHEGAITGELDRKAVSEAAIMSLAVGRLRADEPEEMHFQKEVTT